jgi:hypothetical protein
MPSTIRRRFSGYNHCELADKPHGKKSQVIRNGFFTIKGQPYDSLTSLPERPTPLF